MTCRTGKIRHPTAARAKVALVGARAAAALRSHTDRREQRVYRCPFCSGWHLTSKDKP